MNNKQGMLNIELETANHFITCRQAGRFDILCSLFDIL